MDDRITVAYCYGCGYKIMLSQGFIDKLRTCTITNKRKFLDKFITDYLENNDRCCDKWHYVIDLSPVGDILNGTDSTSAHIKEGTEVFRGIVRQGTDKTSTFLIQ